MPQMKRVEAIIRPEALEGVKEALIAIGITGMHFENVVGHGSQGGIEREGRAGQTYRVDMIAKVKVTTVVSDFNVDPAIEAISAIARSGRFGDGKIFVSDVQDAYRVRTGERGSDVLENSDHPEELDYTPHFEDIPEPAAAGAEAG